jgi:hypothetical protein
LHPLGGAPSTIPIIAAFRAEHPVATDPDPKPSEEVMENEIDPDPKSKSCPSGSIADVGWFST